MNITECLTKEFPSAGKSLPEEFLLANPNVMELPGNRALLEVVPAYMVWCAKNPDSPETITDFTLSALAEYGRCKDPNNGHLNFKFVCSPSQIAAVIAFLEWAPSVMPFCNLQMMERALHNWKDAANNSLQARRP